MHDQVMSDIKLAFESIEDSLEQLNMLARLQKISLESHSSDIYSHKLLDIIVPSVQRYCLNDPVVAMEDIDGVALEGFGSAIMAVWNQIVKAFKWLWEKITWLFTSTSNDRTLKRLQANEDTVKDIVEKAAKNAKFDAPAYITRGDLLEAFRYLNTVKLDDVTILENAKAFTPLMGLLRALCQYYTEFSTECNHQLETNGSCLEDIEAINKFQNVLIELSDRTIDSHIKNSFSKITNINHEILHDNNVDLKTCVMENNRSIEGLLFSDIVYFVAHKGIVAETIPTNQPYVISHLNNYQIIVTKDPKMKLQHDRIPYLSANGLTDHQNVVLKNWHAYTEFKDDIAKFAKTTENNFANGITVINNKLVQTLRKASTSNVEGDAVEATKMILELGKSLLVSARNSTTALLNITHVIERDLEAHVSLLITNTDYYKS